MQTLSYGYKNPQTNDKGTGTNGWFAAINDDITQLNAHNHDGVTSALLPTSSLTKSTSSIAVSDWTNNGGGSYSVVVTVPIAISGATAPANDISYYEIVFKDATAGATLGDRLLLTVERESSTTFTVRSNRNIAVSVLYI